MATLTNEQIEQEKNLLTEKEQQMNAGTVELSDEDLDKATGGWSADPPKPPVTPPRRPQDEGIETPAVILPPDV